MKIPYTKWFFEELESTQTWALAHLKEFPKDTLVLIQAATQTGGYGITGPWISLKGNLHVSLVYFNQKNKIPFSLFPLLLWSAVATVFFSLGVKISWKWPNDLIYQNQKFGGILGDLKNVDNGSFSILGLGINIHEAPKIEGYPTTALKYFIENPPKADFLAEMIASNYTSALSQFNCW